MTILLTALLALATPVAQRRAQDLVPRSPAEIARSSFPSVVLIATKDRSGQPLAIGSGFFVRPGAVVTNAHVLEGAGSAVVKLIKASTVSPVEAVLAADPSHDLLLIAVSGARGNPLPLGGDDLPEIGSKVYAIGNPRGLEGTFSDGIVSGVRTLSSGDLLQITAPISPGSSGGPLLDSRGRVIGVAFATFQGGQNLNFAIPTRYVTQLLKRPTSRVALPLPRPEAGSGPLDDIQGAPPAAAIEPKDFNWRHKYAHLGSGESFYFFLANRLTVPVRDVRGLVIFYDDVGQPLDFVKFSYNGSIPGGLAKLVDCCVDPPSVSWHLQIDSEIRERTTSSRRPCETCTTLEYDLKPHSKVEIRILNFETGSPEE